MKKVASVIMIVILLFTSIKTLYGDPITDIQNAQKEEQKIISELLNLDMENTKAERELMQINKEIQDMTDAISRKSKEIENINNDIMKERQTVRSWFRFLYMDGTNAVLSLLLKSKNAGELLHRLVYIDIITNYFFEKLDNLNKLVNNKKDEENKLNAQKLNLIERKKNQMEVIKKINELKQNKNALLEDIKRKISGYQKILDISNNIDRLLPSLDYLLSNLSKFPWDTLETDDLSFSFLTVSASFKDNSITNMIQEYDDKLKNVTVKFSNNGFAISDDGAYTLSGVFSINNGRVMLNIKSIDIGNVTITGDTLEKMLSGYNMTINIQSPIETFKLKEVITGDGYVKFILGK